MHEIIQAIDNGWSMYAARRKNVYYVRLARENRMLEGAARTFQDLAIALATEVNRSDEGMR